MRFQKLDYDSMIWKSYWWITIVWMWKKVWRHQRILWKCNVCWTTKEFRVYHIIKWWVKSCWCLWIKHKNVVWDKYGKLTIIEEIEKKNWRRMVHCICDCGNEIDCNLTNLIHWHPISCWCEFYNVMKSTRKYWDKPVSEMRLHHIWDCMIGRVKWRPYNTRKYYYDKWIKCEWKNFEEFYNDMKDSYEEHCKEYWEKDTTLDRIDCDWNYCKENCRWATNKEQAQNHYHSKNLQDI